MLRQTQKPDQLLLPAAIIRMWDGQINPVPDDREFRVLFQTPKPRQSFQQKMPDMVHRKAAINRGAMISRDWCFWHGINPAPGMHKAFKEIAVLIESTNIVLAPRPLRRAHRCQRHPIKLCQPRIVGSCWRQGSVSVAGSINKMARRSILLKAPLWSNRCCRFPAAACIGPPNRRLVVTRGHSGHRKKQHKTHL